MLTRWRGTLNIISTCGNDDARASLSGCFLEGLAESGQTVGCAVSSGSHLLDVDNGLGDLCAADLAEDSVTLIVIGEAVDSCREPTEHQDDLFLFHNGDDFNGLSELLPCS